MLYTCTDSTAEGRGGKGNSVSEEDVCRSYLYVFFGCEIRSAPWLGNCAQRNGMFSVVKFAGR